MRRVPAADAGGVTRWVGVHLVSFIAVQVGRGRQQPAPSAVASACAFAVRDIHDQYLLSWRHAAAVWQVCGSCAE